MTNFVTVNDVGPRDGLQNDPTAVSVEDRGRMINALIDAGVPAIEAASFVSPEAVPKMAGAGELFAQLDLDQAEFSALIPNQKGYELATAAGAIQVALVLSATNTMNEKNINMNLAETVAVCESVLKQCEADGVHGRAYVSVAMECPFEGLVNESVIEDLTNTMLKAGAKEVIIADTIGAAHPGQVKSLFSRLTSRFGAENLSAHFHDTRAMALANAWEAIEQGIRKFDASIGGLGGCPFAPGAAGNLATEDLVYFLHQAGFETGIDLAQLWTVVDLAEELVGHPVGGRTRAYQVSKAA